MCLSAGGVIEDVPRGTTAGEILREKGVLAILEDDASSTDSDAEPSDFTTRSSSSSSSSSSHQQQGTRSSSSSGGTSVSAAASQAQLGRLSAADTAGMQQQQVRLVNVNNRLVSEDTVLSDGDLVILARERIKI
jgi:molybdopterin converting factor small subunit